MTDRTKNHKKIRRKEKFLQFLRRLARHPYHGPRGTHYYVKDNVIRRLAVLRGPNFWVNNNTVPPSGPRKALVGGANVSKPD